MTKTKVDKLDFKLPTKIEKKQKGFYIAVSTITFVKDEADRLGISENEFLEALVNFYKANADLG